MTGETNLKFQRGVRAPDGIHDYEIKPNGKPRRWEQPLLLLALLILFLVYSQLVYMWG